MEGIKMIFGGVLVGDIFKKGDNVFIKIPLMFKDKIESNCVCLDPPVFRGVAVFRDDDDEVNLLKEVHLEY